MSIKHITVISPCPSQSAPRVFCRLIFRLIVWFSLSQRIPRCTKLRDAHSIMGGVSVQVFTVLCCFGSPGILPGRIAQPRTVLV